MEIQKDILISVIVVTFNSADHVKETLESIKRQNYAMLELIISDDCSKDSTVDICQKWIEENPIFYRAKILTTPKNTGVPANLNRGIAASTGEWIKAIAGDDILLDDCIKENLEIVKMYPKDFIFISNMKTFRETVTNFGKVWVPAGTEFCKEDGKAERQYQFLLKNYFGNSPTLFINKKVFDVVRYDEEIRYMEDYPFALNSTRAGFRFVYCNRNTVGYRLGNSLVNSTSKIFNDFYRKEITFKEKYIFPNASSGIISYHKFEYNLKVFFDKYNLNKKSAITRILYRIATYANPYRY